MGAQGAERMCRGLTGPAYVQGDDRACFVTTVHMCRGLTGPASHVQGDDRACFVTASSIRLVPPGVPTPTVSPRDT